jgi:DNA modification methylase
MSVEWRNRIVGLTHEPPDQLLANPKNWRIHPKAQQEALRGVLSEVGWVTGVIQNDVTGHMIDGHDRVENAISTNQPQVPVIHVELSQEEEDYVLATFDPITNMAMPDDAILQDLLAGVSSQDDAVNALLDSLRGDSVGPRDLHEDDADLTPPEEPITQPGDLWLLGEHRLLCGDSTSQRDVERLMNGSLAEMLWTDPPYGVSYVGKTKDALTIQNDGASDLPKLLQGAYASATAALEPGAPFYIAHPPGALHLEFWLAAREASWHIHEELIWVKDSMVLGHSDYHLKHEPILYGWTQGEGRSGRGNHESSRWYGDNAQTSVLEFDRPKQSLEHPTMKPTELIEYCIRNSSPKRGIVLDLFGGSGSTLIAAEQTGRKAYLMEIDPGYCDVIVRRWETVTGKQAVRQEAVVAR